MEELKRKALLISLLREMSQSGSWCSETHIQKTAYFLQEGLGVPLGYEFILYKYGPFSFDLRDELSSLRADNFVGLIFRGQYGPSYKVNDAARIITDNFPKTIEKHFNDIKSVASKVSAHKVGELERMATALYVLIEMKGNTLKDMAKEVNRLKPHITEDDAETSLKEVSELIPSVTV